MHLGLAHRFFFSSESATACSPYALFFHTLAQFRVDSLVAVQLWNWLSSTTQADASISDIERDNFIMDLGTKVAKKSEFVAARLESGI